MSSIPIHTSIRRIEPGASADVQPSLHAHREFRIGKCGSDFGWRSDATREPSRRSAHQRREALAELDARPCAKHLPDGERFPQGRFAPRGGASVHEPRTARQQRAADRFRFGNRPEGGGNTIGTLCRQPLAGARRMSAGLGAGLRGSCAPLCAGRRWFATIREPVGGLQKEAEAVVLLQTSLARSAVPLSARCAQRVRNRKTQELTCIARHVVCSFESSRSVLNVPVSGKEGRHDQDWEPDCLRPT